MAKHESESTYYLYGQYANIRKDILRTSRIRGIPSYHCYSQSLINIRKVRGLEVRMYKKANRRMDSTALSPGSFKQRVIENLIV